MPTKPQMMAVIIDRRLTDRTRSILPADAVHLAGSVVEADYRLGGLGHGVAEHEDEGGVVAGHSEGTYAVVSEISHEDLVAHEHEDGDGGLA